MCVIKQNNKPAAKGGIDVHMTCEQSGKPITKSNKYGMFCEDMCDLQENKDVMAQLKAMFPGVL